MPQQTITKDVPKAACSMRGAMVQLQVQPQGAPGSARRLTLLAYTGKPVRLWYWGNAIFDLDGIELRDRIAVLADHASYLRVGFTDSVKRDGGNLVASGQFLANEEAAKIVADADSGFPFQASVGLDVLEARELFEGQVATVNGIEVAGPITIMTKTVLREISIVTLGADSDTEVAAASNACGETTRVLFRSEDPMPAEVKPTPSPATVTASQLREQHPAQIAELSASAAAAAAEAERDRALAILDACADTQLKLGRTLIEQGVSATDALGKLNADLKQQLEAARTAALGGPQSRQPIGAGNGADAGNPDDPDGKLRAAFPADERGQKAYQAFLARQKPRS